MSVFIILKLWFHKPHKSFFFTCWTSWASIFDYIIRPTNNVAAHPHPHCMPCFLSSDFFLLFVLLWKWKMVGKVVCRYVLIYSYIKWFTSSWLAFFWSIKSIPNVYIGKFRFTAYYIYGNRKVLRCYFFFVVAGFRISFTFFSHFVYFCFCFFCIQKSHEIRSFSINSSIFALVLLHK